MKEHPLRDLARQVMEVARKHSHWSQAQEIMNNAENHLILMAQHYERMHSDHERSSPVTGKVDPSS